MDILYVYADFDWIARQSSGNVKVNSPMLIGELGYESLRGSDSYSFQFDKEWLRRYGNIMLSADINNYPGQQYTLPGRDIFGCISDPLPDQCLAPPPFFQQLPKQPFATIKTPNYSESE